MKIKEHFIFFAVFLVVAGIFFYKSVIYGYVPFPGDLLISEYNPWKTYSYLGYVPGSYPNKAQYFDVLRQLYPWKTLVLNQLRGWDMPLWNPYNFSGAPLLANFQSGVFYPFNLFYLVFSQIQAWSILVILQPLLASFFTYLFARKIGISKIGSLFSALSYGFSSFMTVWLEYNTIGHVIMWLPPSLLAVEMLLKKINILSLAFFIVSISAALLAGHPQVFTYSLLFIVGYQIYRTIILRRSYKDRVKELLTFSLLIMLSIAMGAIQIIPGIELTRESARVPHDYTFLTQKILIQPWQFIMMVVPDFFGNPATRNYWVDDTYVGKITYVGLLPLLFVLFAFKNLKKNFIIFFTAVAGIVLLLSSFNPLTAIVYKFNLPFISSSAPTLSIFLFCFCVSILCGFGIDIWRKEKQSLAKTVRFLSPLIFIVLVLWFIVFLMPHLISDRLSEHFSTVNRNLLYATFLIGIGAFLLLVGTVKRNLMFLALVLLLVVHTGDLFRYFGKFNPFVPKELVFPNAPILEFLKKESGLYRFWGYGSANLEANFATQHGLFSVDGYDPLYPKWYGEFIQSSKDGKINKDFTVRTRSDAVVAGGFGEADLSSNIYRLKVLDLLGAKFILDRIENKSTEETFPKERFKLIYDKDGWKIFENIKALPRAFLASDYKVFHSKEEFEKIFFDKNFDPLKTILLEEEPLFYSSSDPELVKGESRSLRPLLHKPNKIVVDTKTDGNKFLFLSDTYYQGWKAYVDGKETKIYRADYAFRSIVVPKGEHEIKFVYDPDSFRIGLGISAISFILTSILLVFFLIRPKYVTT